MSATTPIASTGNRKRQCAALSGTDNDAAPAIKAGNTRLLSFVEVQADAFEHRRQDGPVQYKEIGMSTVRLYVLFFVSSALHGASEAQIAPSSERSIVSNMVSAQIHQAELLKAQTEAITALKKRFDALEARVAKVEQASGMPKAPRKKARRAQVGSRR